MKKFTIKLIAGLLLITLVFAGCKTPDVEPNVVTIPPRVELIKGKTYSDEIGVYDKDNDVESTEIFNKDIFYRNHLLPTGADPHALLCTDETDTENYGRYFCWGTTGTGVYNCFASTDCVSWELCYGSYVWAIDGWEGGNCYAPEVIWDKDANPSDYGLDDDGIGQGVYFMHYTAAPSNNYLYYLDITDYNVLGGLAVSSSPYGPYKMWNGVEKGTTIAGVDYGKAENFKEYTTYKNQNLSTVPYVGRQGDEVTNDDVWFNISAFRASLTFQWQNRDKAGQVVDGTYIPESAKYMVTDEGAGGVRLLDLHAFVDPVTNDKYLYFARAKFGTKRVNDENGIDLFAGNYVYVIKTLNNDWSQLDYSTATRLTRSFFAFTSEEAAIAYNKMASEFDPTPFKDGFKETKQYHQKQISIDQDPIAMNEGPVMTYNADTGLYYMTISSGNYGKNTYCVIQLVGYSPVGPFRKLDADEGGMVLSIENTDVSDIITGVGHHSITYAGDEMLIVYHRHFNLALNEHNRYPATDRLVWVKNSLGMTVLHANGPSSSLQPKFYGNNSTKYDIISGDATVTVDAKKDGVDVSGDAGILNDGVVSYLSSELEPHIKEFEFTSNKAVITLTFDNYRDITAIMVYNSRDYNKTFSNVKLIEMDFIKDGVEGTAFIKDLAFNWNMNVQKCGYKMRAGGSAVAVFNELKVKQVRITIENTNDLKGGAGITALSEVYLLGKPVNS